VAFVLTARLATASHRSVGEGRSGIGALGTVLRNPAARLMTLLIASEFALVGMMDILLVVLALQVLGMSDAGPGILNSAIGVGGFAGAALTFTLIGRSRLAGPLVLGAVGAGVAFALAGQAQLPVVALALVAVCGAGIRFYDVASRTFIQRLLPDHLLTAMFGLQEAFAMTAIALGTLAAPALVGLLGAQAAFLVAGCFLPATAVASYGVLRRLDAEATVPADVLALLMPIPVFAVLAPRVVERLARDAVAEEVRAGECVVRQGDAGTRFYVIASGTVRVDIDGAQVRELRAGDWFGEIALLRSVPRTATITATTEVSLWGVDRDSFLTAVTAVRRSLELADTHIRDKYV
jgi:hypothetical protein